MNCPNCHILMNQVQTKSHYEAPIVLNQCPECGGIWFDKGEMFQVKQGEAVKIESPLNAELLTRRSILENSNMLCPKDGKVLDIFKDPLFPKELIVEHCDECGGFWFNRGEFKDYQDYLLEKDKKPKGEKLERAIDSLLKTDSGTDKYKTLANLGEFLSTPMGYRAENPYQKQANQTANIALAVLEILLRLFLKSRGLR